MLINQFFKITAIQSGLPHTVDVELNPEHEIYQGHFPGKPVAPGVCLVQMVKETLETILSQALFMENCSNIKFTAVLNPFEHPHVKIVIDHKKTENDFNEISASVSDGEIKFLSLKAKFREI